MIPRDLTRAGAAALDATSPLREHGARFDLPDGLVYLDGNSLGPLPHGVAARMDEVLKREWGQGLIGSWNDADWIHLPRRVAAQVAPLVGARAEEVHVGDSTSVLLFKTMTAAMRMRPGRQALVLEPTTFPTDGYVAAGLADLLDLELRWCAPEDPASALDEDVALLALTHVDFRTGRMYDMAALTEAAHAVGALAQWDLCHSTGAVPVDLTGCGADFAVGCGYKYLNGGPGAPAFAFVAQQHHDAIRQPITGWMGHARPFDMERDYAPVPGIGRLSSGTPGVLGLSALEAALAVFADVDVAELRAVSLSLTDLFVDLVDARLGDRFEVITPRSHADRGSQVSLRHPEAYGVVQALIARKVVGDFRTPDVARFGFAPLYVSHVDVWDAVDHLVAVLEGEEHLDPAYAVRNLVT